MKKIIMIDKYHVAIALLCVVILASFTLNNQDKQQNLADIRNSGMEYTIKTYSDYPLYYSLGDMTSSADYIVLGKYNKFEKTWNMNRNPENPLASEDEVYYFEGEIYEFQVIDVIKGAIEQDNIFVNLPHTKQIRGEISNQVLNASGEIIKVATEVDPYSFNVAYDYYFRPQLKETVLLFLSYDSLFNIYFPSGEPYVIAVKTDGVVELRSNLIRTSDRVKSVEQPQIFSSEGGQFVYYSSEWADNIIEDYLGKTTIKDVLQEMDIIDQNQIEKILSKLDGE